MGKNDRIILIDTDVVSHFIYAGELITLPNIFDFKIKVLDKVYEELKRFPKRKTEVDNLLRFKLIEEMSFPEDNDQIKREYAHIKKLMFKGDGEAACMAVARYSKNILASSNLRDIAPYCKMHSIDYLTTMDFLCEALRKGIFDLARCNAFINKVIAASNRLPVTKMEAFKCEEKKFLEVIV
jgi:hypothetical protein